MHKQDKAFYFFITGLVLLIANMHTYAQAPSFEKLQEQLRVATNDTAKYRLYLELSRGAKSNDQSVAYADSALTIATLRNDSALMSGAFFRIAGCYWLTGNFNKAFDYGIQADRYLPANKKESSESADILFLIGNINNRLSHYEKAIEYYDQTEYIVGQISDKHLLPRIYNNRGVAYMNNSDLDKALENYSEALQLMEQKNDTVSCISIYRNIGTIYHDLGQSDKQLEALTKAMKMAEGTKNIVYRSSVYADLGQFYKDRGDMEDARVYFEKLLEFQQQTEDKYFLANIYNKLSGYYNAISNKELAFKYQHKALSMMMETGSPKGIAAMHNILAELYQAENLSDSSIYHANQAYLIADGSKNHKTQAIASLRLSQYYQRLKEIQKSIEYAQVAYNKALEVDYLQLAKDAALQLGDLYETTGRYKESNSYLRSYHQLADSLQRMENTRKIARLSSQMEYEMRESELNSQITLQQNRLKNQKWLGGLLLCILILTGTLAYTSRKSAISRKKSNIMLSQQKEELETTNEELSATIEELSTVNDELHLTYKELELHREHLEELVKDKTAQLQQALQQAQESDRFKAAFFANMSHEIRTPLNAVLGFLQFIDDPSLTPGKRKELVGLINSNAKQLLQMVDDIVTLSKIDSGLLTLQPGLFRMDNLLNEVSEKVREPMMQNGKSRLELIFENRLPAELQTVFIDGKRIQQVLLQLIGNAVKFTERGFIMFGCETDETQSMLHFFVEDTGPGISDEHLHLIFKRFWKQGDLYTQSFRGIGIGLSLCEELVHLMDGTISVESTPGSGSVFRFSVGYEQV